LIAAVGALIILCAIAVQAAQLYVSIRSRRLRREPTGDPWDGRSLEWATPSPPPEFNLAVLPNVMDEEPYWGIKQRAREAMQLVTPEPVYQPIEMPRNSPSGFVTAFFATVTGFALIWHIWWLALLGLVGAYVTLVVFVWRDHSEIVIPAEEVARADRANRRARAAALRGETL
jgi:cytochrome o ubiquinol oxidase subunit 1